jgi:16S rRNA G966 N2-methylase RsmD
VKKPKNVPKMDKIHKSKRIKVKWEDLLPFFPTTNKNVLEKIQITKECLFSTTNNSHSTYIKDLINLFYTSDEHKNLTITDATSCSGGTFMGLVQQVKKINAIELNSDHVALMKHNLKIVFPQAYKKINIVNANYLNVWNTVGPQNVIIIDPPWGGMDYKKQKNLKLYLKDKDGIKVELMDIIEMIMKKSEVLIIRVPYNYDKSRFHKLKCCSFVEQVKFMKQFPGGNTRILYYIYVLSTQKPLKPLSSLDSSQYYSTNSYREIEYAIMDN